MSRFLNSIDQLRDLPQRIDRLINEVERYNHLLQHPAVSNSAEREFAVRIEDVGSPPGLDEPDAVEKWLKGVRIVYAQYKDSYQKRHDAFFDQMSAHGIWSWKVPAVACKKVMPRLDSGSTLVVFADHGFRIAPDGRSYGYSGDSTLERLVPVLYMLPR